MLWVSLGETTLWVRAFSGVVGFPGEFGCLIISHYVYHISLVNKKNLSLSPSSLSIYLCLYVCLFIYLCL